MGMTVMIVMGLLSVLAISSIDFDQLDELRAKIEEAREEQEEETFEDTSQLGWLDVGSDGTNLNDFGQNLLPFAAAEQADADAAAQVESDPDVEADLESEQNEFDSFSQNYEEIEPGFATDAANDLWPLESQSESEAVVEEETEEPRTSDMIDLAEFNAQEEAIELPYSPKQDEAGVDLPPEVSVAHHGGWTEIGVDGDMHTFAHNAKTDFTGLKAEDVLLRRAA